MEEELVMVMKERRLDLLGVCEAKIPRFGSKVIRDNYQLIHKGKEQERKYGVAFIMTQELADTVEKTSLISERIISVTIKVSAR